MARLLHIVKVDRHASALTALRILRVVGLILTAVATRPAAALTPEEAKAAFVYNFAKFTDWPVSAFKDAQSALLICVVNASTGEMNAFSALNGKSAKSRELKVQAIRSGEPLTTCHITFLAGATPAAAGDLARAVRGQQVLSISDVAGAAEAGSIIGLVPADGKLQIVVNTDALSASRLKLSSHVLQLARIVKDTPK